MTTVPAAKSRRDRAAILASRSGLLGALEALPRRPGVLVLTYHRIGDPEEGAYDDGVFEATPEQFDEQVRYLKSHFQVTELREVILWAEGNAPLRHSHVLITFDDGYADNYEVAFPI